MLWPALIISLTWPQRLNFLKGPLPRSGLFQWQIMLVENLKRSLAAHGPIQPQSTAALELYILRPSMPLYATLLDQEEYLDT